MWVPGRGWTLHQAKGCGVTVVWKVADAQSVCKCLLSPSDFLRQWHACHLLVDQVLKYKYLILLDLGLFRPEEV